MTQVRQRVMPAGKITPQQKLIYVSEKLGLPGIKFMQGATMNIFDTIGWDMG